ncbi:MAG: NAD(P)-dependent oxidoreductase [Candidatus Latescibacterota bacterium]|nr:NAD(P)-dependent oxidoreductase [Candidatus Latescibacterota bacterium]
MRLLVLGACGNIGPSLTPGLSEFYELTLTDTIPHPNGLPVESLDIRDYDAVEQACADHDAILNLCVVRDDPVLSFEVNTHGVDNISRALVRHGIKRVLHTGPQLVRQWFDHDFRVDDVPPMPGTGYYCFTKFLGMEISRAYARQHGINTVWFLFNGVGPKPEKSQHDTDHPPFTVVWEDLVAASRLALEAEDLPDHYQYFNLTSYVEHGKYAVDKARRLLGFEIGERLESYFRRTST